MRNYCIFFVFLFLFGGCSQKKIDYQECSLRNQTLGLCAYKEIQELSNKGDSLEKDYSRQYSYDMDIGLNLEDSFSLEVLDFINELIGEQLIIGKVNMSDSNFNSLDKKSHLKKSIKLKLNFIVIKLLIQKKN